MAAFTRVCAIIKVDDIRQPLPSSCRAYPVNKTMFSDMCGTMPDLFPVENAWKWVPTCVASATWRFKWIVENDELSGLTNSGAARQKS